MLSRVGVKSVAGMVSIVNAEMTFTGPASRGGMLEGAGLWKAARRGGPPCRGR